MIKVYTGEQPPQSYTKSIFLAGPSPRSSTDKDWRQQALLQLQWWNFDGVVFVPLFRNGPGSQEFDFQAQCDWETKYLAMADCIVFWVPRDMKELPGLTTNVEWGMWFDSGKAVLGYPPEAEHMRYLHWHGKREGVPVHNTLEETIQAALTRLGAGDLRTGGEREVPLFIWSRPEFQDWYAHQRRAGNRLDGAKVVWTFRVGKNKERVFLWALHVDVWIKSEDRHKTNEVVVFRPDISTVVAYCPPDLAPVDRQILDTRIALVREFRSPANTSDGFIRELPGGSSPKAGEPALGVAVHELEEETGLTIPANRFRYINSKQIAGTLAAHKAHVFAVELSPFEMARLEQMKEPHGVVEDTERTFVEVGTVQHIITSPDIDWAVLGMITAALL